MYWVVIWVCWLEGVLGDNLGVLVEGCAGW